MKILATFFVLFFALPGHTQSACKCNCLPEERKLCASGYDIEHPCGTVCAKAPVAPPMGNLACPTSRYYNQQKGIYQWVVICFD